MKGDGQRDGEREREKGNPKQTPHGTQSPLVALVGGVAPSHGAVIMTRVEIKSWTLRGLS